MSASESSTLHANTPVPAAPAPSNTSKVPLLGEGFQETTRTSTSKSADSSDAEEEFQEPGTEGVKQGKRRLFGFGKKKEDDKTKGKKKGDLAPIVNLGNSTTTIAAPVERRTFDRSARACAHPGGCR